MTSLAFRRENTAMMLLMLAQNQVIRVSNLLRLLNSFLNFKPLRIGEKLHLCDQCGKAFGYPHLLKRHKKSVHHILATTSKLASGRPMHENWYGYEKVHINGKVAAKCLNCLRILPNTAKARLETHRLDGTIQCHCHFVIKINFLLNFSFCAQQCMWFGESKGKQIGQY